MAVEATGAFICAVNESQPNDANHLSDSVEHIDTVSLDFFGSLEEAGNW